MEKLLIIGSGEDFIDVINIARKKGMYSIVCDNIKDGPAKKFADKSYDVDLNDYESLEKIIKEENVSGIFSSFSDITIKSYADMTHKFNMRSTLKPVQIPLLTNKKLMKFKFTEYDIPTSKYKIIKESFNSNELSEMKFPLIMKPLISSGSKGIFIAETLDDVKNYINETLKFCNDSNIKLDEILVEEYIDGEEIIISSWVVNGVPYIQFVNDRELYFRGDDRTGQAIRNVLPSKHSFYVYDQVKEITEKVAKAFEFENGPCIIQTMLDKGQLKVIEVLGRISGANDHKVNEIIGSVNTLELAIEYIINGYDCEEILKKEDIKKKKACIFFPIILKSGTITKIENIDKIKELPFVKSIDKMKSIGEVVHNTGDMRQIGGRIFIVAENLYLAYKYEKIVKEMLHIKDEYGNQMIENFI